MEDTKKSALEEVEDTMACSAFAEAGEPCPLHKDEKVQGMSVEDTMACTAFAEAGEPCPVDKDKEKKKE